MECLNLKISDEFYEDETRCGYYISKEMKKIWAIQLDLLYTFSEVCHKYNITYYAFAGTLLGAVRHGGFIPWDDDIDIMIDRNNYNRLASVAKKEFNYPYFFQTNKTDPGSMRGHAQLRNSNTTAILESERMCGLTINQGIFIDIFQFDNIPDDIYARKNFVKKMRWLKDNYERLETITDRYVREKGKKGLVRYILHLMVMPFFKICKGKNIFYSIFEKQMVKYEKSQTKYIAPLMLRSDRYFVNREQLGQSIIVPFEMINIPIPEKFDEILETCFGNWRKFVIGKTVHGEIHFDPDHGYLDYINSELGENKL